MTAKATASKISDSTKNTSPSPAGKVEALAPINAPLEQVMHLHQTLGNQAVQQLFRLGKLQAALKIGQPNDIYEQEADRVADQVMRMPDASSTISMRNNSSFIQRTCAPCSREYAAAREEQRAVNPANLCPKCAEENKLKIRRKSESSTDSGSPVPNNFVSSLGAGEPLDRATREYFEPRFGMDFSHVRVHAGQSASESASSINALAYTLGSNVVFGAGHYQPNTIQGKRLLAHELTHVVQQAQVKSTLAKKPHGNFNQIMSSNSQPSRQSNRLVQRQVRINGGATRVKEAEYLPGGSKSAKGSKRIISKLITDSVRRVFADINELEDYSDGKTDYIGDVITNSAGTFWYRLPKNQLTVLGEIHDNPAGNVEDVILGLQTSRFMYEPFNELASVSPLNIPFAGTQSRLTQINSRIRVAGLVNRTNFNPDLENIIIKALTGASITRNEFIPANPATMNATQQQKWGSRATTSDYSYGERTALYLAMGIHIAKDISQHNFGQPNSVESLFIKSGRNLQAYYLANQTVLDTFMTAKDNDDLLGIYELTKPNGFQNLTILNGFTLALHNFASRYIEQLGAQSGNKKLEAEGQALSGNTNATLMTLSPAREEIMWEKIQKAKGYLIVGMGDAHRTSLQTRLQQAGIPNEEVEASLKRQSGDVNAKWVP